MQSSELQDPITFTTSSIKSCRVFSDSRVQVLAQGDIKFAQSWHEVPMCMYRWRPQFKQLKARKVLKRADCLQYHTTSPMREPLA